MLAQVISSQIKQDKCSIGEISWIIFLVARSYPSLSKAKMATIYKNYFKSQNLYKFCHLKNREDKNRDKNITFENGRIKIKKVTSTLRNFGNIIKIWLNSFLNYSMVLINFFRVFFLFLFWSLLLFYSKIRHFS